MTDEPTEETPGHEIDEPRPLGTDQHDSQLEDHIPKTQNAVSNARNRAIGDLATVTYLSGTGLAALYLTRYIGGTGAQILGGLLLWGLLFGAPLLALHLIEGYEVEA